MNGALPLVILAILFTFGPAIGRAQDCFRYWYDGTCSNRIRASLIGVQDSAVQLQAPDGSVSEIDDLELCQADQFYAKAYRVSCEARAHLIRTPYVSSKKELGTLRDELILNHVSAEQASRAIDQPHGAMNRIPAEQDIRSLNRRWIEIHGVQYRIALARCSDTVTGISELTVGVDKGGQEIAITPDRVKEISLLPAWWPGPPQERVRADVLDPFRRRGPPSMSNYSPEVSWEYKLIYDPVQSVWTDKESAQAHQLMSQAAELWRKSNELATIAEARWCVHQGDLHRQNSAMEASLSDYGTAIRLAPSYAEAYLERALAERMLHRIHAELSDLNRAIECGTTQQNNGWDRRQILSAAYEARAQLYSSEQLHDQAIADANSAIGFNPNDADKQYERLLFEVRKTAAEAAANRAKKIIDSYLQGVDPGESGFELAIATAGKACDYNPDESDGTYHQSVHDYRKLFTKYFAIQAEAALTQNNFEAAIALATRAQEQNPDGSDNSYQQLADSYRQQAGVWYAREANDAMNRKDYSTAIDLAKTGARLGPDSERNNFRQFLAQCLFLRGSEIDFPRNDFRGTIADMTESIQFNRQQPVAFLYRAVAHYRQKELQEGLPDLNEAIRLDAKAESAYFLRAVIYADLGELSNSVTDLTSAITLDPRDSTYRIVRAKVYSAMNKLDLAIGDATEAIRLQPSVVAYNLRANLWRQQGNLTAASDDVASILKLDPTNADALALRSAIEATRRTKDPHYFNRDGLSATTLDIVGVCIGEAFSEWGKKAQEEGESDVARGLGFFAKLAGEQITNDSIDDAIMKVFPNFPEREKVAARTLVVQFMEMIKRDLKEHQPLGKNFMQFLGAVGIDFTKDEFKRQFKQKYPEWAEVPEMIELLLGLLSASRTKQHETEFRPRPGFLYPLAGNRCEAVKILTVAA